MNKLVAGLGLALTTQVGVANASDYVEVTKDTVNIRLETSADSTLVGKATKGMIFDLVERKGEWFEIKTPSSEYRYLHASLATEVDAAPELTDDESVLRPACTEFTAAEGQANKDAEAQEPDLLKQIDLARVLVDEYKLAVFERHNIHPAQNTSLLVWCVSN